MKILSVSDQVAPELSARGFDPEIIRGVELILACGDLPPEHLGFLRERIGAPLYYVRGNHDIRHPQISPPGCREIHGRLVREGPLRLLGLGGCRWYNGGPHQYHEREMAWLILRLWFRLRLAGGVDVVIAHAPPRGIHDAEDRCHRGFRCFRSLIRREQPAWFIHGHVHGRFNSLAERITIFHRTRVLNTCGYACFEV